MLNDNAKSAEDAKNPMRLVRELWIFTGIICFLVVEIGSFHNQLPDYWNIVWVLLGFAGVGTFGALRG